MAIPSTPQNPQTSQASGQVQISWDFSPGSIPTNPITYTVNRSTDGVTFSSFTGNTTTTNSLVDSTATVNTKYYYQVSAANNDGTSGTSEIVVSVPTNAGFLSLYEARLRARQMADRENSQFITDSELNFRLNQAYFEFYDMLETTYEMYYAKTYSFTADGTTNRYTLPTDFFKELGLDIGINSANSNGYVTAKKFNFIARNRFFYPNIASTYYGMFNLQYDIVGNTLMLIPAPSGGQQFQLWYAPRMTPLLKDNDVMDGINGWTDWVICDAAKYILDKEESDTTKIDQRLARLMKRIEETAANRDEGQPSTISDTRTRSEQYGAIGSLGFDGGSAGY